MAVTGYDLVAILTDLNGKPIPQYYDSIAGVFKPLTELIVFGAGDGNRPIAGEYVGQMYQSVETGNAWRWSGTDWEDYSIPASAARQDEAKVALEDILAKIIAAPATEAKQDTGNTAITAIKDTAGIKKITDAVTVTGISDIKTAVEGTLSVDGYDSRSLRGKFADRPAAGVPNTDNIYWAVDTDQVFYSDGTTWLEV